VILACSGLINAFFVFRQKLAAQEESNSDLQSRYDEETKKLNKEINDLRRERDKLSAQVGETEAVMLWIFPKRCPLSERFRSMIMK